QFATRLLGEALRDSKLQLQCGKFVGQLWTQKAWRDLFQNAGAEGAPPPPDTFSGVPLTPVVRALLGLYGNEALEWCLYAYFTRAGGVATGIGQAILASKFDGKAVVEAIGAVLTELEARPELYPGGIPGQVVTLLSKSFAARQTPDAHKHSTAKIGSLPFSRDQAATLIQTLLSTELSDDAPPNNDLENALAETAWLEADEALARALQQTPALD